MIIGILKETDSHFDKRVPITPYYAKKIKALYPHIEIKVQPSEQRVFSNAEYENAGITLSKNLNDCDVLIGIKKPILETLIPNKTYLFFAHVAKQQASHKKYFQEISKRKITLIDFEYFSNENGKRLTAFGYMAGIVGTYHLINMLLKKQQNSFLPLIENFQSAEQLIQFLKQKSIKPTKIVLTGKGKVATGASYLLKSIGIAQVSTTDFINNSFDKAVFCILSESDYITHKQYNTYNKTDFRNQPKNYISTFNRFTCIADAYIACHYWKNTYPNYLTSSDLKTEKHKMNFIADISCDIDGPIASTLRESSHANPYFDYNPFTKKEEAPFSSNKNIHVMSIGNLPSAMPREASELFSKAIFDHIIPLLSAKPQHKIIQKATILSKGELDINFEYLRTYLNS